jgi:hypothetical protein
MVVEHEFIVERPADPARTNLPSTPTNRST